MEQCIAPYIGFGMMYDKNISSTASKNWGYIFFDVGRDAISVHICMVSFIYVGTRNEYKRGRARAKSGEQNNAHGASIYMFGARLDNTK